MPAKVTLKIIKGDPALVGKEYVYEERTTCIVGRDKECQPKIPDEQAYRTISRHHCLLDINPPNIRVRDFGSLNGTHVNGVKIGQREEHQTAEEGAKLEFPEHDLKEGDEIQLCDTVFQVGIFKPIQCKKCALEIPEAQKQMCERIPGIYICQRCHQAEQAEKLRIQAGQAVHKKVCAKCGKDVSREIRPGYRGNYVCGECRKSNVEAFIKVMLNNAMLPQIAANPKARESFEREVEVTKALRHPNIAQLCDYCFSNESYFLSLEYCDGGSVDKLMLARGGKLTVDEAISIILQVLNGLDYAHQAEVPVKLADGTYKNERGVVHRDMKPPNILLCKSGSSFIAKVTDFGLGKAFDAAGLSGQTRTGTAAGSPCFMPRQQVINFKYSKPEVDVWGTAACLYNMLCGMLPNGNPIVPRDYPRGSDPWKVTLNSKPIPIRKRNPAIPQRLAEVIDTALIDKAYEPGNQVVLPYKAAADFKTAIQGAI